jgi:hypothetical protein
MRRPGSAEDKLGSAEDKLWSHSGEVRRIVAPFSVGLFASRAAYWKEAALSRKLLGATHEMHRNLLRIAVVQARLKTSFQHCRCVCLLDNLSWRYSPTNP